MDSLQLIGVCDHCKERILIHRRKPFHLLHLLIAMMSFGIWTIVWIGLIIRSKIYLCSQCGSRLHRNDFDSFHVGSSLNHPWQNTTFEKKTILTRGNFNAALVSNNLVYYVATDASYNGSCIGSY